jgi:hypothetical protein
LAWTNSVDSHSRLKHSPVWILLVAAIAACAAVGTSWYHAVAKLSELRASEVRPIAKLLKEDQELLQILQAGVATDTAASILGRYLAAIRADGLPKHADAKQRLDRLAENNEGILALINVYSPHAKTAAFGAEADKFRRYAIAWRDRWNSVMELFMAGGNYPVAEVPFPQEFLSAVQSEIEAADRVF